MTTQPAPSAPESFSAWIRRQPNLDAALVSFDFEFRTSPRGDRLSIQTDLTALRVWWADGRPAVDVALTRGAGTPVLTAAERPVVFMAYEARLGSVPSAIGQALPRRPVTTQVWGVNFLRALDAHQAAVDAMKDETYESDPIGFMLRAFKTTVDYEAHPVNDVTLRQILEMRRDLAPKTPTTTFYNWYASNSAKYPNGEASWVVHAQVKAMVLRNSGVPEAQMRQRIFESTITHPLNRPLLDKAITQVLQVAARKRPAMLAEIGM